MVVLRPSAGSMLYMSETVQRPVSQNGSGPANANPRTGRPSGGSGGRGTGGSGFTSRFDNPWVQRILSVVVLALAAGIFTYGCNVGESADDANDNAAIVEQYPAPGDRALRQTEVGATLALGYDGRLTVNGVAIPEEQMEGALDPDDPANAENIEKYGLRMNSRHRVVFRPGPGKVIEEFERGEIQITLEYFPAGQRATESRTTSWTATVT